MDFLGLYKSKMPEPLHERDFRFTPVCQSELTEFFVELTEFSAELSEFSLPKQTGNSTPPVS